ncbi:hypothetical protein BJX99DRAFT_254872 [Aspergillus californicus]
MLIDTWLAEISQRFGDALTTWLFHGSSPPAASVRLGDETPLPPPVLALAIGSSKEYGGGLLMVADHNNSQYPFDGARSRGQVYHVLWTFNPPRPEAPILFKSLPIYFVVKGLLKARSSFYYLPIIMKLICLSRDMGYSISQNDLTFGLICADIPPVKTFTVELRYLKLVRVAHNQRLAHKGGQEGYHN